MEDNLVDIELTLNIPDDMTLDEMSEWISNVLDKAGLPLIGFDYDEESETVLLSIRAESSDVEEFLSLIDSEE